MKQKQIVLPDTAKSPFLYALELHVEVSRLAVKHEAERKKRRREAAALRRMAKHPKLEGWVRSLVERLLSKKWKFDKIREVVEVTREQVRQVEKEMKDVTNLADISENPSQAKPHPTINPE